MLSKKAKYGVRALLYLAERQGRGPVMIKDIAREERIPQKFLEAILAELKSDGLLRSRAGRGGGYEMIVPAQNVTLGRVLRQIDGPIALISCVSQTAYAPCADCLDEKTCIIRMILKQVRDATAQILDATTLAALLEQGRVLRAGAGGMDFNI